MRGLDTNIILRIFDRTDQVQSRAVDALITAAEGRTAFLLNPIVLAEFAWTMKRRYKASPQLIADHLAYLFKAPEFLIAHRKEADAALRRYRAGTADFADYYLASINLALGCATTLTFDLDAAQDDQYELLKA